MIAMGGALGTGLLIGSGSALSSSGPTPLLIGYAFIGLLVYMVMCCLSKLVTYITLADGHWGFRLL
jgi:amino acid transporter